MPLRRCEVCYGPGPALHDNTAQRYLCKKCHSTPDDPYFLTRCEACSIEAEIGTEEVPHPVDVRLHTCAAAETVKQAPRMSKYAVLPERVKQALREQPPQEAAKPAPRDPSGCAEAPIETDEQFKARLIITGQNLTIASEMGTVLTQGMLESLTAERDKYHRQAQDLELELQRVDAWVGEDNWAREARALLARAREYVSCDIHEREAYWGDEARELYEALCLFESGGGIRRSSEIKHTATGRL